MLLSQNYWWYPRCFLTCKTPGIGEKSILTYFPAHTGTGVYSKMAGTLSGSLIGLTRCALWQPITSQIISTEIFLIYMIKKNFIRFYSYPSEVRSKNKMKLSIYLTFNGIILLNLFPWLANFFSTNTTRVRGMIIVLVIINKWKTSFSSNKTYVLCMHLYLFFTTL